MRAEQVIATHANTDFDAFASMLAARRLYPGAVVCLAGSLNRNVREFYRLHADELGAVEASRLELDAIRRLVVVETLHASRLGELEPVALDPSVEKVVFDHHATEPPAWAQAETTVISRDGALTTTLVGVLAERELLSALLDALETRDVAGVEVLVAIVDWPRYVDGISNLAHKVVDLTDARALVVLVEMGERVFCVARSRTPELDAAAVAASLGGGGHAQAA